MQALQDPAVQARLADTKASEEVRALESFYKMLKHEPARAFYGPKHVARAAESDAVETLLVSDKLFRAQNVAERRKYVDLVDKVGGRLIFKYFLVLIIVDDTFVMSLCCRYGTQVAK